MGKLNQTTPQIQACIDKVLQAIGTDLNLSLINNSILKNVSDRISDNKTLSIEVEHNNAANLLKQKGELSINVSAEFQKFWEQHKTIWSPAQILINDNSSYFIELTRAYFMDDGSDNVYIGAINESQYGPCRLIIASTDSQKLQIYTLESLLSLSFPRLWPFDLDENHEVTSGSNWDEFLRYVKPGDSIAIASYIDVPGVQFFECGQIAGIPGKELYAFTNGARNRRQWEIPLDGHKALNLLAEFDL